MGEALVLMDLAPLSPPAPPAAPWAWSCLSGVDTQGVPRWRRVRGSNGGKDRRERGQRVKYQV